MFTKVSATYNEYPRTFWMMLSVSFIDRLGMALLFPFFALYLTKRFDIGMTEVGVLFAAFSPAQAAIQSYTFNGAVDSGSLIGETYSGSFSFDDAALSGIADEWLSVDNLAMNGNICLRRDQLDAEPSTRRVKRSSGSSPPSSRKTASS